MLGDDSNTFEEPFEESIDAHAGSFGPDEGATHQLALASEGEEASTNSSVSNGSADRGNAEAVERTIGKQGNGGAGEHEAIRATIRRAETEQKKRIEAAARLNLFMYANYADKFLDLPKAEFDAALEAEMGAEGTGVEMLRKCLVA